MNKYQAPCVERADLDVLETIIRKGRSAFLDVGRSLAEISERRLYRVDGFASFEVYCLEKWGFSRRYASRLIAAFRFAEEEVSRGHSAPRSERAARAAILEAKAPPVPANLPERAALEPALPADAGGLDRVEVKRVEVLTAELAAIAGKLPHADPLIAILASFKSEFEKAIAGDHLPPV